MGAVDTIKWACVLCGCHIQNESNESASNFVLNLNIPPQKLSRWSRSPQLCATGDWLFHHECTRSSITSPAEFFGKTSNHPGDSAPLQPSFGALQFWLFPKLKSRLKRKKFQTVDEIQENITGQLMMFGRIVWGPRYLVWRGLKYHCPMYNVSHILYLFQ